MLVNIKDLSHMLFLDLCSTREDILSRPLVGKSGVERQWSLCVAGEGWYDPTMRRKREREIRQQCTSRVRSRQESPCRFLRRLLTKTFTWVPSDTETSRCASTPTPGCRHITALTVGMRTKSWWTTLHFTLQQFPTDNTLNYWTWPRFECITLIDSISI